MPKEVKGLNTLVEEIRVAEKAGNQAKVRALLTWRLELARANEEFSDGEEASE